MVSVPFDTQNKLDRQLGSPSVGRTGTPLACILSLRETWRPAAISEQKYEHAELPGVREERTFHSTWPELVVSNGLLRKHLREDFEALTSEHDDKVTSLSNHIALGLARNGYSRLHDCILTVSKDGVNTIEAALLSKRILTVHKEEIIAKGKQYSLLPSTSTKFNFHEKVEKISSCTGQRNCFFVVITSFSIICISIYFENFQVAVNLQFEEIFKVRRQSLGALGVDVPPCCLDFKDDILELSVLSEDGVLRTWHSHKIGKSVGRKTFHMVEALEVLPSPSRMIRFSFASTSEMLKSFLVSTKQQIDCVVPSSGLIENVYTTDDQSSILHFDAPGLMLPTGEYLLILLTSCHVSIIAWKPRSTTRARLVQSWRHYQNQTYALQMLVISALANNISILLQNKLIGLCVSFTADIHKACVIAHNPARLSLDAGQGATILAYDCYLEPALPGVQITAFLLLGSDGSLISTMIGNDEDNLTYSVDRARRFVGPVFVDEVDMDEPEHTAIEHSVVQLQQFTDENTLNLTGWYHDLLAGASHTMSVTIPLDVDNSPTQSWKPFLILGQEVIKLQSNQVQIVDSLVDAFVLAQHEAGKFADTTPGISLYNNDPVVAVDVNDSGNHDTERYGLHDIQYLLRPWRASTESSERRPRKDLTISRTGLLHEVAASLSLSTVAITKYGAQGTARFTLFDAYIRSKSRSYPAPALNRILQEWNFTEKAESYVWKDIAATASLPSVDKIAPISAIPPFKALKPISAPPVIASSNEIPAWSSTQANHVNSSQGEIPMIMTQPVAGRHGFDRKAKRNRKIAGF